MPTPPDPAVARVRELADGNHMPVIGLGVWQVPPGPTCVRAVRWALEAGYRHIDTAQAYGNEESVGEGMRQSGVERDEIFITTKFFPGHADPAAEAEKSLRRLGVEYVDLYLVHWPQGGPTRAWAGMERARALGYARSIGVSNFGVDDLDQVLRMASVSPVVDQVQLSPFEYRRTLMERAAHRGLILEAYSPLGTGRHLGDLTVQRIAERIGRTAAQVLLRWSVEKGLVVLPKSTHRERIEENAQVFDFSLSAADIATLDALDRTGGTAKALEGSWW